jgi:hypothetical protein
MLGAYAALRCAAGKGGWLRWRRADRQSHNRPAQPGPCRAAEECQGTASGAPGRWCVPEGRAGLLGLLAWPARSCAPPDRGSCADQLPADGGAARQAAVSRPYGVTVACGRGVSGLVSTGLSCCPDRTALSLAPPLLGCYARNPTRALGRRSPLQSRASQLRRGPRCQRAGCKAGRPRGQPAGMPGTPWSLPGMDGGVVAVPATAPPGGAGQATPRDTRKLLPCRGSPAARLPAHSCLCHCRPSAGAVPSVSPCRHACRRQCARRQRRCEQPRAQCLHAFQ